MITHPVPLERSSIRRHLRRQVDAPPINPEAVLALPVSMQRFQVIARKSGQVNQAGRAVQDLQASLGLCCIASNALITARSSLLHGSWRRSSHRWCAL
jgi:hypothetical protein